MYILYIHKYTKIYTNIQFILILVKHFLLVINHRLVVIQLYILVYTQK